MNVVTKRLSGHDLLWSVVRPLLWVRLLRFRSHVRRAPLPAPLVPESPGHFDRPNGDHEGAHDRILLLGSIIPGAFGVLSGDLSMAGRVATAVAGRRGRGFVWVKPDPQPLLARRALASLGNHSRDIDLVVITLGYSDVLLMTPPHRWHDDLTRIRNAVDARFGDTCGIVIAGIPPMTEFRQTPRLGRGTISRQIRLLNAESQRVCQKNEHCQFVAFPDVSSALAHEPSDYSWSMIHRIWSTALEECIVTALPDR